MGTCVLYIYLSRPLSWVEATLLVPADLEIRPLFPIRRSTILAMVKVEGWVVEEGQSLATALAT